MKQKLKNWHVWGHISKVSGLAQARRAVGHPAYLLRDGECIAQLTNLGNTKRAVIAAWQKIVTRDLSKRRDARYQTRIILDLPNSLTLQQAHAIMRALRDKYFQHVSYLITLHKGASGMVARNSHLHIIYNTRSLITDEARSLTAGLHDRTFKEKDFAPNFYRFFGDLLQNIGYEVSPKPNPRERLARDVYVIQWCSSRLSELQKQLQSLDQKIAELQAVRVKTDAQPKHDHATQYTSYYLSQDDQGPTPG